MDKKQHLNSLKFKINYHYIFILVICLSAYSCDDVSWFGEEVSTDKNKEIEDTSPNTKKKLPTQIPISPAQNPTIEQLLNASVKIMLKKNTRILGNGSGVFISSNRIVTNYHVIEEYKKEGIKIIIQCHDNSEYSAKVIKGNENKDVAILEITESQSIFIPKIQSSLPNVMDEIIVIGSPFGEKNVTTTGHISKIVNDEGVLDYTLLQMTAPISPGNSGGPVFNKSGEIIGITVASLRAGQNMNYAVPAKYIRHLLE